MDYQRKTAREPGALLDSIESEAHKAKELLAQVDRLHKEWDHAVATGKFEDAHRAYMKLSAAMKAFDKAVIEATGNLELYEEETETHVLDYPEHFG
jgi:DNA-binding GntR family transcriptional regulator